MATNERPIKWILIGDEIRLSHALYHRDLLQGRETTCEGGGVVTIDKENKTITFSGESDEFGRADERAFLSALEKCSDNIRKDLYFCTREDVDGYSIRFARPYQPEPVEYTLTLRKLPDMPFVPDERKPRVPVSPYAKFDRLHQKGGKRRK